MRRHKLHIATYQRDIYNKVSVAQHLHNDLPEFDHSVVIRLGGSMPYKDYEIQVNKASAVANSADKREQKRLLIEAGLPTLPLLSAHNPIYPCVLKGIHRSGGTSVLIARDGTDFNAAKAQLGDCLIEPLFNTTSEYRLHCTKKECFFAVKKFKRNPEDIIINRDNHFNKMEFMKPRLWRDMKAACVKAMKALDLDIAAFDVLYDSSDNNNHKFTIAEANTNPELLHNTYMKYLEQLILLINEKVAKLEKRKAIPEVLPIAEQQFNELTDKQLAKVMKNLMTSEYKFDGATLTIKL